MLLVAEIANDSVSIGARAEDGAWLARLKAAGAERSADEWALLLRSLLRDAAVDLSSATRAAMASVVPSHTAPIRGALSRFLPGGAGEVLLVGPGVRTGLRIRTESPAEVGSDLVCGSVAALDRVGAPCIVVDFGSALTFSAVAASGDFVGAAIVPGLSAAAETLRERAAQLPEVQLARPVRAIGRNTVESVRSGVLRGYAGLVERMVADIAAELSDDPSAVRLAATGGEEARELAPLRGWDLYDPWLSLEGLAIISDRNS